MQMRLIFERNVREIAGQKLRLFSSLRVHHGISARNMLSGKQLLNLLAA